MLRKIWQIEDYDEGTRRRIKAYAAANGITIPEALKRIVRLANI
ncbi:MAG TPA: hypothetical protein VMV29_19140 [Ktedonobacterales bacterium]|nr:hypothetical protein [Ktedonobacterales bacterium]